MVDIIDLTEVNYTTSMEVPPALNTLFNQGNLDLRTNNAAPEPNNDLLCPDDR